MKTRYISDLHQELSVYQLPEHPDDANTVLIVAGDLGDGVEGMAFLRTVVGRFHSVILVLGNHEYYELVLEDARAMWEDFAREYDNLYLLNPGHVELDGIVYIGATLWGDARGNDWFVKNTMQHMMNEYGVIKVYKPDSLETQSLHPDDTVAFHKAELKYILDTVEANCGKKIVIITHHAPLYECSSRRITMASHGWVSNLEHVFHSHVFDIWVHGHVHDRIDIVKEGKRVLCNPKGRGSFVTKDGVKIYEHTGFDPQASFII